MSMKKIIRAHLSWLFLGITAFVGAQPTTFSSRGVGGGGALFAPSINPVNPSEYYIACDMTEMFHTTDYGLSYSLIDFHQFQGGHQSKMAYTNVAGLLYSIRSDWNSGINIPAKSTDGGVHWTDLSGPDTTQNVFTLDVDYNHPSRMVISNYGQIYFSNNGGGTFTSIHTALVAGDGNTVGGVFFDGNSIYVGTNDGVLVSTTAGVSWTTAAITGLGTGEKIVSFAAGRSGTTTRFFCLTAGSGNWYPGAAIDAGTGGGYAGFTMGCYVCTYGSGNWISSMSGISLSSDYPLFVAMAGNTINTAYIAGGSSAGNPIVLKTSNAGTAWTHVFNTTLNQNIQTGWCGDGGDHAWSFPEVPFGISVAGNDSTKVIFSTFSDVHKTSNGGATWEQAYVNQADQHPAGALTPVKQNYHSIGLENTSCWQVFWVSSTNMLSGYSDIRAIRSADGGGTWSFNYTGDAANSMYRIARAANGTLFAATSGIHDMYQSTHIVDARIDTPDANGNVLYSTDNGLTWSVVHSFGHPVFWIALDPNNPSRAYASVANHAGTGAAGGVYRCDNLTNLGTSTWTLTPTPTGTEGHPASLFVLNDGKLVATFSARNASPFTKSSGCFVYDPTGAGSWTDVSDPGMKYWTKDITIDPNDATQNTWYAAVFCGWGGAPNNLGGLYKTTNRGTSWTLLTNLNSIHNATSCTFNPTNANQIFLTTEYEGLWVCSNVNSTSPLFSPVSSYPFKQPERVFFNPYTANEIWVSSFGNGMKMGTLAPLGVPTFEFAADFDVYPNPSATGMFTVQSSGTWQETPLTVYDLAGRQVARQLPTPGTSELNLTALRSGIYVIHFANSVKKVSICKP
jgi:hypothetical protein